jgi:hypothetical protein
MRSRTALIQRRWRCSTRNFPGFLLPGTKRTSRSSRETALPRAPDSSSRLASGHLSGLALAGPSSCTSMSWPMTSKPPSRASWHWAPGASRAKTAGHGFTPIRPGIRSASYPARRGLRPSENHQALSNCRDTASPVARTPRSLALLIAQSDRICICMMRVARLSVTPRAEASRCAVHTEPPICALWRPGQGDRLPRARMGILCR